MKGLCSMRVIFLGLPGAGKGTQAAAITEDFKIPHIATGDMFRAASAANTALGEQVRKYLESGLLVPDDVTISVVKARLQQADAASGFLLDGFPRTKPQAQTLDEILSELGRPVTQVLYLEVRRDELLRRLTGRRVCSGCGASYHVVFNPPRLEGVCDRCGGPLTQRKDDQPEAVAVRLKENFERTQDLVKFYEGKGLLIRIDGEQPIGHVYDAIRQALRGASV